MMYMTEAWHTTLLPLSRIFTESSESPLGSRAASSSHFIESVSGVSAGSAADSGQVKVNSIWADIMLSSSVLLRACGRDALSCLGAHHTNFHH